MNPAETMEFLRSQAIDDVEIVPDNADHFWACGNFASRANLDAYFSRLTVSPTDLEVGEPGFGVLCFDVFDSHGQHLGRWRQENIGTVLNALVGYNRIVPGGATYVMLNDDKVIKQWQLNVKHVSAKAAFRRVDDLPMFAEGKKAGGDKKARTEDLMGELLGGGA